MIEYFENLQDLAFSERVLSKKFRLLAATAIDAEHGVLQGATALARRAIKLGVARAVAYCIGGNRTLFTSALVLQIPSSEVEPLLLYSLEYASEKVDEFNGLHI
ncbi:MAG: hypothetical protein JSV29_07925 [Candidatus Bathyarchaeota archaeon]|nr:MAG: hypothetical protein JSV29_07925 [Candidatus Bathyarchaeota archaeon]